MPTYSTDIGAKRLVSTTAKVRFGQSESVANGDRERVDYWAILERDIQFIDSMQQLHNDKMIANMRTRWKRTKRHQSALTIALKLGLEKQ